MERGGIIEVETMSMYLPHEAMEPPIELPSLLEMHRQTELAMAGNRMTAGALFDMCPHANNPDIMTPDAINRYMAKLLNENGIEVAEEYQCYLEPEPVKPEVVEKKVVEAERTKTVVDSQKDVVTVPTRTEKVVPEGRVHEEEIVQVVRQTEAIAEAPETSTQETTALPLSTETGVSSVVLPEIVERIVLPEAPDKVSGIEAAVVSELEPAVTSTPEVPTRIAVVEPLPVVDVAKAKQEETVQAILPNVETAAPLIPAEQSSIEADLPQSMVEIDEARATSYEAIAEVLLPMPQEDEGYRNMPLAVPAPFEIPTYPDRAGVNTVTGEQVELLPTQEFIDAVEEALQPAAVSEMRHEPETPPTEILIQEQYAWTVEVATSEPETVFVTFANAFADFARATAPPEMQRGNESSVAVLNEDLPLVEGASHAVATEFVETLQALEPEQIEATAPTVQAIARTVQEISLMQLYEDRDITPDITAAEERLVELVTELCEQLCIEDTEKVQQLVAILLAKDFMAPPQKEAWLDLEHMGTHEVKRDFAPLLGADEQEKKLSVHAVLGHLCTTPSLRSAFN
ncbi:MAG TPA: hypothetical protein VLA92_02730 [Candidatus Saccharimonadales bacterium]|nr:hypothetical protein [Candidatus Saccharimonadales bacterium]